MAKKEKTEKPAATKKAAKKVKAATPKTKKATKPKAAKTPKPKAKEAPKAPKQVVPETARVLNSEVVFDGPLFKILRDRLMNRAAQKCARRHPPQRQRCYFGYGPLQEQEETPGS